MTTELSAVTSDQTATNSQVTNMSQAALLNDLARKSEKAMNDYVRQCAGNQNGLEQAPQLMSISEKIMTNKRVLKDYCEVRFRLKGELRYNMAVKSSDRTSISYEINRVRDLSYKASRIREYINFHKVEKDEYERRLLDFSEREANCICSLGCMSSDMEDYGELQSLSSYFENEIKSISGKLSCLDEIISKKESELMVCDKSIAANQQEIDSFMFLPFYLDLKASLLMQSIESIEKQIEVTERECTDLIKKLFL